MNGDMFAKAISSGLGNGGCNIAFVFLERTAQH